MSLHISLSIDIFLVDVTLSEGEPTSNSVFKLSTDSLHSKKDVDVVDAYNKKDSLILRKKRKIPINVTNH